MSHLKLQILFVVVLCLVFVYSFSSGHKELIQSLTWDGTASRLLSTDLAGVCKIWAMKVNFKIL